MIDGRVLKSIQAVYEHRTFADKSEKALRYLRERLFGVNYSVFDKIIRYYREAKGHDVSSKEALARALDKRRHKEAWFTKERTTINDIMHFYQEVEVYPFRQPYLKRFGGFRWYVRLVDHIQQPHILEYGCGSAVLTEWLLERFPRCRYTVADIPSTTLEFVKWKKATFNYPHTILTVGPGKEGIPLAENYDLILNPA